MGEIKEEKRSEGEKRVQLKRKWIESVTVERRRRCRDDGEIAKDEDEGKAGLS